MNHSRTSSFESFSSNYSTKSGQSIWKRLSQIFNPKSRSSSRPSSMYSRRISERYSSSSLSNASTKTDIMDENPSHKQRHLKQYIQSETSNCPQQMVIPPFSPTYCKTNEFPYSNFYVKLPDGRWMVRYRDGNRDILRTDIMEGYMI